MAAMDVQGAATDNGWPHERRHFAGIRHDARWERYASGWQRPLAVGALARVCVVGPKAVLAVSVSPPADSDTDTYTLGPTCGVRFERTPHVGHPLKLKLRLKLVFDDVSHTSR